MATLLIQAPAEDRKYFEEFKEKNNVDVEFVDVDRFDALQDIIQVIIPFTAALTPILVAYFTEKSVRAKSRKLIKDGKKVVMDGYGAEEVTEILQQIES